MDAIWSSLVFFFIFLYCEIMGWFNFFDKSLFRQSPTCLAKHVSRLSKSGEKNRWGKGYLCCGLAWKYWKNQLSDTEETERHRERQRQRHTERGRQTGRDRERDRKRETEKDKETERERKKRDRETEREVGAEWTSCAQPCSEDWHDG